MQFVPSNGAMKDMMQRLKKVYHDTGGTKWKDEEDAETKDMTPFEASKFMIVKKIKVTREVFAFCNIYTTVENQGKRWLYE